MGYELHIEHPEEPFIDFDRWEAAVRSTKGVRPSKVKGGKWDGRAEMCFDKKWIAVFWWFNGSVTFKVDGFPKEVLKAALALADKMDAEVRGDEGEQYESPDDLS